jgi:hypothetical protein
VSPSIVTAVTPVLASTAPSDADMPLTRRIWDQFEDEQPPFIQNVSDVKIAIESLNGSVSGLLVSKRLKRQTWQRQVH